MDRKDGLLIAGAALLPGALHQLENNAVETMRRELNLGLRRRLRHGRRLASDVLAVVRLFAAIAILALGLREVFRLSSGGDEADRSAAGIVGDLIT